MQITLTESPYAARDRGKSWGERGKWPCHWVRCEDAGEPPFVTAYRCRFTLDAGVTVRVHVTADERYELFADGLRVGRGSERGDAENWFFETYDLPFEAGEHVLVARVWSLGAQAAFAQMTVHPGFLLAPDSDEHGALLGTGVAAWEAKRLAGYTFIDPITAWGTGANLIVDGAALDWDALAGGGEGWQPVVVGEVGVDAVRRNETENSHRLRPATLPPMLDVPRQIGTVRLVAAIASTETHAVPIQQRDNLPDEQGQWQALISGQSPLTVPPLTRRRILLDLENYYSAYPEVVTTGGTGGLVRVNWQEALYSDPRRSVKDNRDEIEGKQFVTVWSLKDGIGDTFLPDGGENRTFTTLWWQCGRYVEIVVATASEPLTLERFALRETRYPLEMQSQFQASDARLDDVTALALRTLQMCSHETYMDCPYFEQLMYVGDTRLQVLTTLAITTDDRLPRKALRMFDASRMHSGLTQSRYPTRVKQIIPPFSLWWVAMLHDFALWRDDPAFVRSLLPGARAVLEHWRGLIGSEGLARAPIGWNVTDWVPQWPDGVPPDAYDGVSGLLNWQFALVLTQMAELEAWAGEPELAARDRRTASELADRLNAAFWDETRGLYAEDVAHAHYSEHTQCLALLSGLLTGERQAVVGASLLQAPDLAQTTIYFSHYLFETCRVLHRPDVLLKRLDLWFDLKKNGLKTTVEMPEPTRSDCHAWGAHPLYHFFATLLGIRPGAFGFGSVSIAPQLGSLTAAQGVLAHPRGDLAVSLTRESDGLRAEITLPPTLHGVFEWGGAVWPLKPGRQEIHVT